MVLKLHAVSQCLMDRASLGDLGKALSLCVVEVTFDMYVTDDLLDQALFGLIAVDTVVRVDTREFVVCSDRLEREPFVFAVQRNCRAGARGQRAQEQFIRVGTRIGTACRYRLITSPLVTTIRDMNDCSRGELGGNSRHASWYRREVDNNVVGDKAAIGRLGAKQVYLLTKFEVLNGSLFDLTCN